MRILGAAVLAMEFFLMGFALLIAKDNHGALALTLGGLLAILALLNAGLLKRNNFCLSIVEMKVTLFEAISSVLFSLRVVAKNVRRYPDVPVWPGA